MPRVVTSIRLDPGERLLLDRAAAAAQHQSLGAYLRSAGLAAAAQQRITTQRPSAALSTLTAAASPPAEPRPQADPTSLYAQNAPRWGR
jgi:hypothetical protein